MFILNQILGLGGFSIVDNLRLIVIAAIFIGIIFVLLYLKSAKNGRKAKKEYMQAANSHDSSSKEERPFADVEDDFLSIEEEADLVPVVNLDKTVADTEDMDGWVETKREAGIKEVREGFATKIEGLISKIEEGDKEVIKKVENVVDTRAKEILSKINDRIDEVLQSQKDSTDLVLEKLINSLRQKDNPAFSKIQEAIAGSDATSETLDMLSIEEKQIGIESSPQSKAAVEKKAENGLDVSGENSDILGERASSLQMEGSSGDTELAAEVPEDTKEEDWEIPSEVKEDITAEEEWQVASPGKMEKNRSGEIAGESDDLDMLDFLKEDSIGISLPDESNANEEIAGSPEETKKGFPEETSEDNEDEKVGEDEPTASSAIKEKNVSEVVDEGDTPDFDIQAFLDELESLPSEKDPEAEK